MTSRLQQRGRWIALGADTRVIAARGRVRLGDRLGRT
jgi:hypothetical protein